MLKSVDVLIGLVVVVLALSMAVTVITQAVTSVINSRGRHLRRGLADLLQQLDPRLTAYLSERVATAVLTHPLISGSNTPFVGGPRLGNVVHREEFTKLIMELATDSGTATLSADAKNVLNAALRDNGIANPEATLKSIRTMAMELERASPQLSSAARQTAAILQAAESDFVAKVNGWFDQTMDRTAQRFTASTRAITFVGAFIVAFGLQVDTPLLVNRLAADDVLRERLVRDAAALPPPPTASLSGSVVSGLERAEYDRRYRDFLAESGVITLPTSEGWRNGFTTRSIWGMLVTSLLLSLGAPFWYGVLRNLLQLRSALAVKDDEQRADRQLSDQPPARPAPNKGAAP